MTRQRTKNLTQTEEGVHGTTTTEDALTAAHSLTQPDHDNEICNAGRPNRGTTIGRDLDRINRGLNTKIPVIIVEGKKRPEAPMQAAKLASEGGVVLRQHIPILTHWKEYKKEKSLIKDYMGKVAGQFTMDTNSKPVQEACADLLKTGQRNMRYRLKKRYINGVPSNKVPQTSPVTSMNDEQWRALVNHWSSPQHMDQCAINALNHGKVKFHQRTGSRCYVAQAHAVKQDKKFKDEPPTAIDLFKATHCSSKTGFSETVKEAIDTMEAMVAAPVEEGQVGKTPTEAVAEVLPKSKFLRNVGLASPKRSSKANDSHVEELQAQLASEKADKEELMDKVVILERKAEESEARLLHLEEMRDLKKTLEENTAFIKNMAVMFFKGKDNVN